MLQETGLRAKALAGPRGQILYTCESLSEHPRPWLELDPQGSTITHVSVATMGSQPQGLGACGRLYCEESSMVDPTCGKTISHTQGFLPC